MNSRPPFEAHRKDLDKILRILQDTPTIDHPSQLLHNGLDVAANSYNLKKYHLASGWPFQTLFRDVACAVNSG